MRITPFGRFLILLLVIGIGVGGWTLWQRLSGGSSGGNGGGAPAHVSGDQGLLGRPLRVGIVYWPGYTGGIYANNGFKPNKDCIFWNNHKLLVEFVDIEDPDQANKAFSKGGPDGVDIVWSTVDYWANNVVGMNKGGVKARAVMQVDWSQGGDAIVADNSIKRVEDLAGKKIALIQFTPSHWLLEYNIANSSLSDEDQKRIVNDLVNSDSEEAARDAFVAGRVPAAVVWEPFVTEALQKRPSSHVLVSSAFAPNLIADIMVAKESFINEHKDAVQAFVAGWLEGATEANRDKTKSVQLLMANEPPYKAAGEEATRDGLSKVRLADLADNTRMFGLDGSAPDFDRIFNQASQAWLRRGYIPYVVKTEDAKDDEFVRALYGQTPVTPPKPIIKPEPPQTQVVLTKPVSILFPTGSAELDTNAKNVLDDQVVTLAKSFSNSYLNIEGNTDNVGSTAANVALSERRAQAVVNYLVARGIDRNQLTAKGNGPNKPMASNSTEEGRAKNRRTDVVVAHR
ncbi:MAG TPA: phosphate ABC transporter substrate-binding/OmpA family protein [Chthonomonadaceae bacterium]|nr:phosphate ABC transporter substrate-binding/OmpA family protein [Chthonomonadaceae bacterium]